MAKVRLYKNVYSKDQFKSTVNSSLPGESAPAESLPSVDEFFNYYNL